MEEIKLKGIVIKSADYKDSDKIVTIFSADRGIIKARARGVKKAKAKMAFAAQPFAFLDLVLIEKGGFYTIISASSIDQFFDLTSDFDKYIFALAAMELCEKTIKENDQTSEMFVLLLTTLKNLCYFKASPLLVFIKFMLEALKFLGFGMKIGSCACCDGEISPKILAFSYDYSGMLCPKCSNREDYLELTAGEWAILKNIDPVSFDRLENLKILSRNDLVSVVGLLCKVFRLSADEELESIKKFL